MAEQVLGILVRVKGAAGTTTELRKLDSQLDKLGQTASKGLGNAVGNIQKIGAAAAVAAGGILVKSVMAASDLNETVSKVGVVFGKSAASVVAFGDGAAESLGMSTNAALGAAGTFGNLLVSMGFTADKSASMSTSLVQLAADLASFNNMDPTEVLDKLRSGLTGESEPLKTLGININDAVLKAKALELGLISLDTGTADSAASIKLLGLEVTDAQKELAAATKKYGANSREALEATVKLEKATAKLEPEMGKMPATLDAATKAQSTYALMFDQTKTAQGDFKRTSDGLANQMRTLRARFENTAATIGTALLPKIAKLADRINSLVKDHQADIERFAEKLPGAFDKALAYAEKIPWTQIGEGLKTGAKFAGDMVNAFVNLPPEVQGTIIALAGLNKLTGGVVGDIVSELGKGLIKGVLGITAGIVNVNAAVANGGGGKGVADEVADIVKPAGIVAAAKAAMVAGAAILADIAFVAGVAALPVLAAAAAVLTKTITPATGKANIDAQNSSPVNQGAGALDEGWDILRKWAVAMDDPALIKAWGSTETVIGRNARALEGLEATQGDVEKLLRENLVRPAPAPVFNFGLTAIVKVDSRDVATVSVRDSLTGSGLDLDRVL